MPDLLLEPLTPMAILAVWERAGGATQPRRALALLTAASPLPVDALAALPLGRRDAALLRVHGMTFGGQIACMDVCPSCRLQLEFGLDIDRLLELDPAEEAWDDPGSLRLAARSSEWPARLPTTADLEAALARPGSGKEALVQACLLEHAEISDELISAFERACAEADPLADIRFTLECTACGGEVDAAFDPVTMLWNECAAAAGRLLEDVHRIAWAYHWPEERILSLPARRRRFYLSRIAQGGVA